MMLGKMLANGVGGLGMASLRGWLFAQLMKWRNIKHMFADPAETAQIIEQCRQSNAQPYVLPAVTFKSRVERTLVGGMDAVVISSATPSGQVIWYLHGGAYIFQAAEFHWQFLDQLVQRTHATVIASNYPLAPNAQAGEVIPALRTVYQAILERAPAAQIVIAGDSAGGGLALACAQDLRDHGLPQPAHVCLLSPWLDIGLHNPAAETLAERDVLLGIPGLKLAGQHWAGQLDKRHPWVSPLFGDLHGLAPLAMWVGTHEIFLPDVQELRMKAEAATVLAHYVEAPGMFHAYQIFPVPEAKVVTAYLHGLCAQLRMAQ